MVDALVFVGIGVVLGTFWLRVIVNVFVHRFTRQIRQWKYEDSVGVATGVNANIEMGEVWDDE